MSEFSLLVQEYYKNPVNNYQMKECDFFRHEGNSVCEDDINVYIKYEVVEPTLNLAIGEQTDLQEKYLSKEKFTRLLVPGNYIITDWSFDGNVSMITQAASSFFSELVVGHTFAEILSRDENLMIENGFEVSPRRRRARVIALLATRNAIHDFLKDGNEDNFDDVLI